MKWNAVLSSLSLNTLIIITIELYNKNQAIYLKDISMYQTHANIYLVEIQHPFENDMGK